MENIEEAGGSWEGKIVLLLFYWGALLLMCFFLKRKKEREGNSFVPH